jgi:hypothetical protein
MRIPLAVTLESRDGSVSKDAKVVNGLIEVKGQTQILRKRPGITDLGAIVSGSAQLLYSWNGINAIIGDTLYRGTQSTIISAPSSTAFSPSIAGLRFDAQEVGASAATDRLMVKNRTQAWTIDRTGAKTAIAYGGTMGAATYPVVTLTRSSTTATATFASETGFNVGDSVIIAGAGQAAYNGTVTITAVTPYSYTPAVDLALTITRISTTATAVSATPHGLTTGTYTLSGATQSEYNGSKSLTVVDANTFTFTVTVTAESPATPATGSPSITAWSDGQTMGFSRSGTALTFTNFGARTYTISNGESVTLPADLAAYWGAGPFTVSGASTSNFSITVSNTGPTSGSGSWYIGRTVIGSVSSITRSGTTATITTSIAHKIQAGDLISVSGATQTEYNLNRQSVISGSGTTLTYTVAVTAESPATPATGSPVVTIPAVTVNATASYTVAGSPATPATGTITAQGNGGTVPGIAYIDGYFVVMDANGVMWHSDLDDPTSWPALNFLTAQNENGDGRAIGKSQNYLIAFKEWSTEFFYDAKNATGFAFNPVDNGFTQVGCASGESVIYLDGAILWLSQVRQRGRSVHLMQGLQQQKVSSEDIDRILNADTLGTVYAFGAKLDGHTLYVLTLVDSDLTLVFDVTTQSWHQWTTLTAGSTITAAITRVGTTATAVCSTLHGVHDGDPVSISGAAQPGYNGIHQVSYVSPTVFTFDVDESVTTPATGTLLVTPYTSSYFKFTKYADYQGLNLLLHESDGHLYHFNSSVYQDDGVPVDLLVRTTRIDGGTSDYKTLSRVVIVGDTVDDTAMLRWSDDDYRTNSSFRSVDLSSDRPAIRRCGKFRRRSFEFRHIGNTSPRIESLDLEA